jgi:hypothetical protein
VAGSAAQVDGREGVTVDVLRQVRGNGPPVGPALPRVDSVELLRAHRRVSGADRFRVARAKPDPTPGEHDVLVHELAHEGERERAGRATSSLVGGADGREGGVDAHLSGRNFVEEGVKRCAGAGTRSARCLRRASMRARCKRRTAAAGARGTDPAPEAGDARAALSPAPGSGADGPPRRRARPHEVLVRRAGRRRLRDGRRSPQAVRGARPARRPRSATSLQACCDPRRAGARPGTWSWASCAVGPRACPNARSASGHVPQRPIRSTASRAVGFWERYSRRERW